MKWVIGILGVVTFVVFIWASSTSDHTPEVVQADPKQWASIYAEMSIKRLLKAPASADFCRETVTELGDNRYDVSSCVDSENSYGAKLRSNWQVIYKFSGGNPEEIGSWTPEKIIFDGKVVYPSE